MTQRPSLFKKLGLGLCILAIALVVLGYLTAKSARTDIETATHAFVKSKGIMGRNFGGERVVPEVSSHVEWPFVVVGSYFVPADLHGSYHKTTYLALPWGTYALSKEEFFPI
ncbi:MAG: hypothetical protein EOO81_06105 [Oxalobacteraceae bacterium]|nr:MAG: hypothetical protein EOO81_06105 [Oxalobacteraceae bacterium]